MVGTDIIEVNRIERLIKEKGGKFLNRIYTQNEIDYCESKGPNKYQHYAGRFAAKEAIYKAANDPFSYAENVIRHQEVPNLHQTPEEEKRGDPIEYIPVGLRFKEIEIISSDIHNGYPVVNIYNEDYINWIKMMGAVRAEKESLPSERVEKIKSAYDENSVEFQYEKERFLIFKVSISHVKEYAIAIATVDTTSFYKKEYMKRVGVD